MDAISTTIASESLQRLGDFSSQPAAPPDAPPAMDARRVRRILAAEDNPVNQRLLLRMLQKRGHSVVLTANGLEAVEAFWPGKIRYRAVRYSDAGNERPGGDRRHTRQRTRARRRGPNPDCRHHGERHARRPRALPGRRDGRLHRQTDPARRTLRNGGKHVYNTRAIYN